MVKIDILKPLFILFNADFRNKHKISSLLCLFYDSVGIHKYGWQSEETVVTATSTRIGEDISFFSVQERVAPCHC